MKPVHHSSRGTFSHCNNYQQSQPSCRKRNEMTINQSSRSGSIPVHFETPRLRVRPFVAADAGAFTAYRAHPDVERYQSWSDYTIEQGRALIDSMHDLLPGVPGQWYQFALEERQGGALIGDLALKVDGAEPSTAELGFTLAPEYQGNGYGLEAVRELLGYAFGTLHLRRLTAVTDALNYSAALLLDRVGMRREAYFHENIFFKGAWGSECAFAILDREWAAGCGAKQIR
ncbi:N-acetyltransferase [Arthrobacter frigidicola]|nr:N-acetyltransferase [Arthrobacter frigidicola]